MSVIWKLFTKVVYSLIIVIIAVPSVFAKTIRIIDSESIYHQMIYGSTTYDIKHKIDLQGDTLRIPANSIIRFNNSGCLCNGTIIGSKSKVIAPKRVVFRDICISGQWENDKVYSEWISFPEDSTACNVAFSNLMTLCNGENFTHVYLKKGRYFVEAVRKSAPILVPSNVYWHNNGDIIMLPNSLTHYSIVYLNKVSNVTIDGGSFIGDARIHYGDSGEWGHGIKCGGATDIYLKNFSSKYNWGDGIDLIEGLDNQSEAVLNCNNIIIENVKCLYNRRQGLSIEAAHNVSVSNSEFAYTGTPVNTPPGAGVDIEPWTNNNFKVSNIRFYKCSMHDNKGFDMQCEPNIKVPKDNSSFQNNIELDQCSIGIIRVQFTNGLKIKSCNVFKKLLLRNSQDIDIQNSIINDLEKGAAIIDLHCHDTVVNDTQVTPFAFMGATITGLSMLALKQIINNHRK